MSSPTTAITGPTTPQALQAYTDKIIEQVTRAIDEALLKWDPSALAETFLSDVAAPVVQAVSAGQASAAAPAQSYVSQFITGYLKPDPLGTVMSQAFAGVSSTGGDLNKTMYKAVIEAKTRIGAGQTVKEAMDQARQTLHGIAHTQIYDAQRAAVQVAMVAEPSVQGYVRELRGSSCNRCMVLAGAVYRYSTGFKRHPKCDCVMRPLTTMEMMQKQKSTKDAFNAMSKEQQDKIFGPEAAEKIRGGADMASVVNTDVGMSVPEQTGDRIGLTAEGMPKGWAKITSQPTRPMPADLIKMGGTREEILQRLREAGYVSDQPGGTWLNAALEKSVPKTEKPAVAKVPNIGKGDGHAMVGSLPSGRDGWVDLPWTKQAEGYLHEGIDRVSAGDLDPAVRAKIDVMQKVERRIPKDADTTHDLLLTGLKQQQVRTMVESGDQILGPIGRFSIATKEELVEAAQNPKAIWVRDKAISNGGTPEWRLLKKADGTVMGTEQDVLAMEHIGQIPYRLTHDGYEYAHGGDAELLTRLRQEAVANNVSRWATTSGDTHPEALAMQKVAEDLFGLEKPWYPKGRAMTEAKETLLLDTHWVSGTKSFLRGMYEETQDWFTQHGYKADDEIVLWRGTGVSAAERKQVAALVKDIPDMNSNTWVSEAVQRQTGINLVTSPMSSWSVSPNVARTFGHGKTQIILQSRIPIRQIIGCPRSGFGCLGEDEFVVLASQGEATIVRAGAGLWQ